MVLEQVQEEVEVLGDDPGPPAVVRRAATDQGWSQPDLPQ